MWGERDTCGVERNRGSVEEARSRERERLTGKARAKQKYTKRAKKIQK